MRTLAAYSGRKRPSGAEDVAADEMRPRARRSPSANDTGSPRRAARGPSDGQTRRRVAKREDDRFPGSHGHPSRCPCGRGPCPVRTSVTRATRGSWTTTSCAAPAEARVLVDRDAVPAVPRRDVEALLQHGHDVRAAEPIARDARPRERPPRRVARTATRARCPDARARRRERGRGTRPRRHPCARCFGIGVERAG